MRVFDFTLLSGYEFSGVDVAQGFRARLFAKNNVNAKFIFTELPTIRDMELYGSQKIKRGQIMSAHLFMTGRLDMSLSVKKEALLENEKENYEYDNIDEDGKVIRLYNSGEKSVEILCDEDGFVINESLFKNGKKYLENYYTDSLSYTELYNWDNDSSDGLNLGRRIFWNKQGQMVYEQCIYKDNVEYLFKNGEVIDNVAFVERFIKELNLCENDICIMDRAGYLDYIQPLFENKGKSKLIAVLHSDHFYKIYEDESSLYMNYEYYYWFKYSEAIDYFVVGTDEHKRSLEAFLKEYDCFVPHIAAIPPGAIPEGKLKSKNNRWQGSIISASRLSPRKGIDILIKSVIKAHEINQTINLDIYGSGNDEYTSYLQNIVKDAGADDYIHFKGRCNLEKIYPHYELFASFSLWETFGLSLMEAVGDGLAMVGLDVRYGNRLFIHPDENGYLVDFDIETDFQNKDKLCERTAAAIVKIFEDDDRLKKFHENSYMIAEEYKEHDVVPDAKSGKAGEPVEMRFTKAEYDSLEAVIEEVFASYVNLTRQNDNFFVAMHPLHIRVAEHVLKGKRIIATFFENRFDFTQTSLAADFLEHAENIITDSDYTTKLIMENLGAVNNKPVRLNITDIPPYDTRMDFGISSQLRVQNILVPVDGLTEDAFARIIKGLADYLTINDLARVHFFTRDASWGHEDAIKNDTVKLLDSMGYDSRLVTGDGEAALGFGGSGADAFAENELGDIEKTVEQRFFVDVCVDERDISKCINEQRVMYAK